MNPARQFYKKTLFGLRFLNNELEMTSKTIQQLHVQILTHKAMLKCVQLETNHDRSKLINMQILPN